MIFNHKILKTFRDDSLGRVGEYVFAGQGRWNHLPIYPAAHQSRKQVLVTI